MNRWKPQAIELIFVSILITSEPASNHIIDQMAARPVLPTQYHKGGQAPGIYPGYFATTQLLEWRQ